MGIGLRLADYINVKGSGCENYLKISSSFSPSPTPIKRLTKQFGQTNSFANKATKKLEDSLKYE
ncbi:hypothetical protein TrispH2_010978 [Trichoplax sp. H2]|nr:hypothetical protein TrispH2_010978 [Trichoplax sp. H2]|eukprot:RDD37097.1 hypothetical protein TrispH2_010978 [Trichoplax sp. H2]